VCLLGVNGDDGERVGKSEYIPFGQAIRGNNCGEKTIRVDR
jgi:hypothetical protein